MALHVNTHEDMRTDMIKQHAAPAINMQLRPTSPTDGAEREQIIRYCSEYFDYRPLGRHFKIIHKSSPNFSLILGLSPRLRLILLAQVPKPYCNITESAIP